MQQAMNFKHVYTYMSGVYDFGMYRWTYNTESINKDFTDTIKAIQLFVS